MPNKQQSTRQSLFLFPQFKNEKKLPFLNNRTLQKYKTMPGPTARASIDNLPNDLIQKIMDELLFDPEALQALSMVSRRFLAAMMQPQSLGYAEDNNDDSEKWYPFLEKIFETRRLNGMSRRNVSFNDYLSKLRERSDEDTEKRTLASISYDLFLRRMDHLLTYEEKVKSHEAEIAALEYRLHLVDGPDNDSPFLLTSICILSLIGIGAMIGG